MKKIIVGDLISTSTNYVKDIREAGYEPIMFETYNDDGGRQARIREANYEYIDQPLPRIIKGCKNYEDTLELIRKEDPYLVIPGTELSVEVMTKVAYDLGLLSNDKHNLDKMTLKHRMHEALKEANLRYIKGKMISTLDEAVDFFHENNNRKIVLKPTHGVNSTGVHICANVEQIKQAYNNLFDKKDTFGGSNLKVLIQEYIEGTEYVVNTISRGGSTYVSSIYRYGKKEIPGGSKPYLYFEAIMEDEIDDSIRNLMDYAIQTTKAVGVTIGPVHGEYYIDDKGPVLVEVNCRISGGNMPAVFLDKVFGHHETDKCLDAYLSQEKFDANYKAGYKTYKKGISKVFVCPEDMDIDGAPVCDLLKKMPTFVASYGLKPNMKCHLKKTIDLETSAGKAFLVSEDKDEVMRDCLELQRLEEESFDKLFNRSYS